MLEQVATTTPVCVSYLSRLSRHDARLSSEWETHQWANVQVPQGVGMKREKKKPRQNITSIGGNKSGIFPWVCSSHVKAILITILPVILLTLDCCSLNYIWARIPPFHSRLLNAWMGIDPVFEAVSDWFPWLMGQEVASLAELNRAGSPSKFHSLNSITKDRLKRACDVLCLYTCLIRVHVINDNWSPLLSSLVWCPQ